MAAQFAGAPCTDQPELPWTSDTRPNESELNAMRLVCAQCSMRVQCAALAMTGGNFGRPVDGGFYAGVWLPWPSAGESGDTREMRRCNRRYLRRLAGIPYRKDVSE